MEKFLLKPAFRSSMMKEMCPGDVIRVACNTWNECNSVKVCVCNFAKAYPRTDVSRYGTKTDKSGEGYIITITAIA